jgi:hypothetical protein
MLKIDLFSSFYWVELEPIVLMEVLRIILDFSYPPASRFYKFPNNQAATPAGNSSAARLNASYRSRRDTKRVWIFWKAMEYKLRLLIHGLEAIMQQLWRCTLLGNRCIVDAIIESSPIHFLIWSLHILKSGNLLNNLHDFRTRAHHGWIVAGIMRKLGKCFSIFRLELNHLA